MNKTEWQQEAIYAARRALRYMKAPFLAETLLEAVLKYIPAPSDKRSFGHVIRKLEREKVIQWAGIGQARTSNGQWKPKWRAVRS